MMQESAATDAIWLLDPFSIEHILCLCTALHSAQPSFALSRQADRSHWCYKKVLNKQPS